MNIPKDDFQQFFFDKIQFSTQFLKGNLGHNVITVLGYKKGVKKYIPRHQNIL